MDWANIINSIGVIIVAYLTYNQYTKNKVTDYKLEKWKAEDKIHNKKRIDNGMIVYGELWDLLYELKADRVYIIQPFPLGHEETLSIYFEVKRRWAEPMRPNIQRLKISEVAKFSSELAKNLFMYITDIQSQVKDRYAQSIFSSCGTKHVIVKKLSDNSHDWVGSIVCEFIGEMEITEQDARLMLHNKATNIQYILPEIKE